MAEQEPLFDEYVTLTMEDGTDVRCEVVAIFPAPNGNRYVAVTPDDDNSEDLYLFRLEPDDEGGEEDFILVDIEDDDELDIAADAFDELLDEQDWADLTEE